MIEPQIKTVSKLKDNSMKIPYPLLFQLSSLQTLDNSKSYVSIFPSFLSRLSKLGFLNQLHQIFGETKTSFFFQITS